MGRDTMLGHKLRRLRREQGRTQAQMASAIGISTSYLNLIENNRRAVTVPVLLKLAQAFDINLRSFTEDDEARLAGALVEVFSDSLLEEHTVNEADLRELAAQFVSQHGIPARAGAPCARPPHRPDGPSG